MILPGKIGVSHQSLADDVQILRTYSPPEIGASITIFALNNINEKN